METTALPIATPVRPREEARFLVIDLLKAVASQIIVLHHLVAYGPLSEDVHKAAPHFIDWMYNYGRWAPQVFLVVSGFLLARGYAPQGIWVGGTLWQASKKRYLRLILPYLAALVLAAIAAALVRPWLGDDPNLPPEPTWTHFWAHVLLVQNVMGIEALSAGVWYIAIDFQLFVLMALILWVGKGLLKILPRWHLSPIVLVGLGMAASLLFFNRDDSLDNYAIYFLGSYSLGAMAYWLGRAPRRAAWIGGLAITLLVAVALGVNFRGRLVLALVVALILLFQQRLVGWTHKGSRGVIAFLGKISYSLFLVHYPILLLANLACVKWEIHRHGTSTLCAVTAWLLSIVVASIFHRWIEAPCAKLGRGRR